ncbi:TniQ family protein [Rhizobium aegyptiacum]|uniref:TniQ family protein n=1 Tax=Rhizobium aegyptiacum TaxID=1764550 RepID=UPI0007E58F50
MRRIPLLPIAPRPYDGELISSWQERVACRYGCTAAQIDLWLECGDDDPARRFLKRDFHPRAQMLKAWARSCRLRPNQIEAMALGRMIRPAVWYVDDRRERGTCAECLDEDAAEGRDHFLRLKWGYVEAAVCVKHRRTLRTYCECCFARGWFRFDCLRGRAVLVCRACARPVSTTTRETEAPAFLNFKIELAKAIQAIVEGRHVLSTDDLTVAMQFLWMPTHFKGKPYIAWLRGAFGLHPLASAFQNSLSDLSVAWRIATLLSAAQLLGLVGARQLFGEPPTFMEQAFAGYLRGSPSSAAERPAPATKISSVKLQLRSDAEYRRLAEKILASGEWKEVAQMKGRSRDWHVWRLMSEALKSAPVQSGVLPPASS